MRPYHGIVIVTIIACGPRDQDAETPVGSVVECGAPDLAGGRSAFAIRMPRADQGREPQT